MCSRSCLLNGLKVRVAYGSHLRCRALPLRSVASPGNLRQFTLSRTGRRQNTSKGECLLNTEEPCFQEDEASGLRYQRNVTITRQFSSIDSEIPLHIQSLGQPAAIRVLRERPLSLDQQVIHGKSSAETEVSEELFQGVTEEKGKFRGAEAVKNIENIRETFNRKKSGLGDISLNDCRAAAQTLLEGFTAEQLYFYIQSRTWGSTSESDNLDGLYHGSQYKRSRWFVGESDFPADARRGLKPDFASKLDSDFPILRLSQTQGLSSQHKRKSKMVEVILRYCWGYRTREEKAETGTVDIEMEVGVLSVLLKHSQSHSH